MTGRFHDDMTLREARDILRELVDEGHKCPCCTQFAKVYKRKIGAAQSWALIALYRAAGRDWCHVPSIDPKLTGNSMDLPKLRYWGLIEEQEGVREDGSKRVGWWRLTERGTAFVRCEASVPTYARVYNGRCLSLVGDPMTIRDALGTRFNYSELMAGV